MTLRKHNKVSSFSAHIVLVCFRDYFVSYCESR